MTRKRWFWILLNLGLLPWSLWFAIWIITDESTHPGIVEFFRGVWRALWPLLPVTIATRVNVVDS